MYGDASAVVVVEVAPLRIVRGLLAATPGLAIELSMRRSLPAALEAIGRGEIDAVSAAPTTSQAPGRARCPAGPSCWSAWRSLSALATRWQMPRHSRQPISPTHSSPSPPPARPPR